ncbi:MAG: hypothetical protein ABL877_11315 [Thiobacillus sp.]
MNTLRQTTFALLIGASLASASAFAASSWDNVPNGDIHSYPASTASTAFSGHFSAPLSFAMLDSDGVPSQEALFGSAMVTRMAAEASPYIGTSDSKPLSYWDTVPNN